MTLRLSSCQPWREGGGRGKCPLSVRIGRRCQSVEMHYCDVQNKRGGMMAETLSSTAPLWAGDEDTGENECAADGLRQRHSLAEKQPAG